MTPNNYTDPGPYENPQGTVAYEVQAHAAESHRGSLAEANLRK